MLNTLIKKNRELKETESIMQWVRKIVSKINSIISNIIYNYYLTYVHNQFYENVSI